MTLPWDGASGTDEVVLPTYEVFARFREGAPDAQRAVRSVTDRLTAAEEPFHEVTVIADDDAFLVLVRFVLVSVDAHTAVVGLSETLASAGVAADEVWAGATL